MKICKYCGAKNFDINTKCEDCNNPFLNKVVSLDKKSSPSSVAIAAKVFLLLNMIGLLLLVFVCLILYFAALCIVEYRYLLLILSIYTISFIVCAVITIISYIHYRNKLYSGEKIGMGFKIFVLLFVNLIAGILMLCDSEAKETVTIQPKNESTPPFVEKMKVYKELLDSGIITQEEFDAKKKELLGL